MDSDSGQTEVDPRTIPLAASPQLPVVEIPREGLQVVATVVNPGAENPPWTAIDLFIAAGAFVGTVVVCSGIFLAIAVHGAGKSAAELAKTPSPAIVVPAMALGYIAMLATMYLRTTSSQALQFWPAIAWRWPSGNKWLACLAAGGALAVGLGLLSRLLPFPKSLPMERFFRDPQSAYLMMFMGVIVAPFFEEMSFRGFFYPVLDRWLQTLFMVRQQLLGGGVWLLMVAAWGYLVHRLSGGYQLEGGLAPASALLLAILAFLVVGVLFFIRWVQGRPSDVLLLAGLGLCAWGMMSRSVSGRTFGVTTSALVGLALVLGAIGATGALSPTAAGRLGRALAVLVTGATFAMLHGEQLGEAWGPLLVIFIVGMVLTITRVVTRSVAPGFLIHVAYNLTLFTGLYFGSDHFRHLERMSQ